MSTNSYIAYYNEATGKVVATYCHYDGFIECNGKILVDNYNDQYSAEAVASGGYYSALYETIGESVAKSVHSEDPVEFDSIEDLIAELAECPCIEYAYLWVEGQWFVLSNQHRVYPVAA